LILQANQNGAIAAMLTTTLYAAAVWSDNMNNNIALILSDDLLNYIKNAKERAHIYQKDYADGYVHALSEIESIIESCHTNVEIVTDVPETLQETIRVQDKETDKEQ
jgi:hypothetical protein